MRGNWVMLSIFHLDRKTDGTLICWCKYTRHTLAHFGCHGTLPAAVDKPDRGNWPCAYINIIVSFYTSAYSGHVLRVPHPSGIKTDSRPLKETALRCRNAQISHPDHPRTMYLLTDVDPKLLIHVDSCMYMYVKKAATWESRATLSMKSGFVGSRRSLALGASDSSTASLPFRAPGKLRDGSKKKR